VLESCSNPQRTWQVLKSAMKKVLVVGFSFFVSDIISGVGLWPFWLRLPGPGPHQVFIGNLSRIRAFWPFDF